MPDAAMISAGPSTSLIATESSRVRASRSPAIANGSSRSNSARVASSKHSGCSRNTEVTSIASGESMNTGMPGETPWCSSSCSTWRNSWVRPSANAGTITLPPRARASASTAASCSAIAAIGGCRTPP